MNETARRALAPTMEEIRSERAGSAATIAAELLGSGGGRVLDVGCGDGRFTRTLTRLFAEVSGIDVKANKIAEAQQEAAAAGLAIDFRVASAEAMAFPDASFDVVIFSNSLHHMPSPDRALGEAARVLVPGGRLYVMEPVAAGNYFEATRLVNDETAVRTEAYQAIGRLALCGVAQLSEHMYRSTRIFADFDEWRAEQIDLDEKRRARFEAQPEEVRRRFEASADRRDEGLAFEQVFRVNLLAKEPALAERQHTTLH
jgi:hypothetical protein